MTYYLFIIEVPASDMYLAAVHKQLILSHTHGKKVSNDHVVALQSPSAHKRTQGHVPKLLVVHMAQEECLLSSTLHAGA
jgi:hypothetical protein